MLSAVTLFQFEDEMITGGVGEYGSYKIKSITRDKDNIYTLSIESKTFDSWAATYIFEFSEDNLLSVIITYEDTDVFGKENIEMSFTFNYDALDLQVPAEIKALEDSAVEVEEEE